MSIEFLTAVLPPKGPYCAVSISPSGRVTQTFHDTVEALNERAAEISASKHNAYFALSSFRTTESRKAVNAAYTRSFFLDLDCGPGKPWPDQAAAMLALRAFVDEHKFPAPYIVNSGRGLHVYWPLVDAVPTEEWVGYAMRFKGLCLNSGFAIDPQVPADAARVLRVPDTLNFKTTPPCPVVLAHSTAPVTLDEMNALLPVGMDFSGVQSFKDFTNDVSKGNFPTSEFKRIVVRSLKGEPGCQQIARAVQQAATLEEPLWRAALAVAWHCTDAESAIHMISRDHPEYDYDRTFQKASNTKGPTTCRWYRDNYPEGCAGCQHNITSPILLGRKVEAAPEVDGAYVVAQQLEPDNEASEVGVVQVTIPTYPFPYFRGVSGGVYRKSKTADGEPVEEEIYPYDLYLTSRYYDSDEAGDGEGELVQINLHTPHDGIRRFVTPTTSLMSKDKLRDVIVKHGVVAFGKQVDQLMAYFAASIKNMQRLYAADRTRNQMGWTLDNSGFVVGELEYTATGVRLAPAASGTRRLAGCMTPRGDLEEWSRIANFYSRPDLMSHQLTVLFGFASPLLKILDPVDMRGALINLVSNKSGTGKTTAQMVVNSIFGHPHELLLKKDDTLASRIHWMGMMNSIAVTMDEITNISDEDLSALAYEIPQGRGKHRMESQTNKLRANTTTWCNLAISSSNSSMYDKLGRSKATSVGEIRRLIEIPFKRPDGIDKKYTDPLFAGLTQHYGVAGPVFMQHIIPRQGEIRVLMEKVRSRLDAALGFDQADRFYSHSLTVALSAGIICNKLGILNYDMGAVFEYVVGLMRGIEQDVVSQASDSYTIAKEALASYINENLNNGLIINGFSTGIQSAPITMPKGALKFRYEPDTQTLWIPVGEFRSYLASKQISLREAMSNLAQLGIAKNNGSSDVKRITAGAVGGMQALTVRCYEFNGQDVGVELGSADREPEAE